LADGSIERQILELTGKLVFGNLPITDDAYFVVVPLQIGYGVIAVSVEFATYDRLVAHERAAKIKTKDEMEAYVVHGFRDLFRQGYTCLKRQTTEDSSSFWKSSLLLGHDKPSYDSEYPKSKETGMERIDVARMVRSGKLREKKNDEMEAYKGDHERAAKIKTKGEVKGTKKEFETSFLTDVKEDIKDMQVQFEAAIDLVKKTRDDFQNVEQQCSIEVTAYGPHKEKFIVKRYHGRSDADCDEAISLVKRTVADIQNNINSKI
jgi:hypothetical protein